MGGIHHWGAGPNRSSPVIQQTMPGSSTLPARGRRGEGHTRSGSCWGTSPSPGPGQVPICHGRRGLEAVLTNLVGNGSDKGAGGDVMSASKEKRVGCALPRVAREAVCLQDHLIQGVPRAGSGAVGSHARKSLLPPHPTSRSPHAQLVKSKAVVSPPSRPCVSSVPPASSPPPHQAISGLSLNTSWDGEVTSYQDPCLTLGQKAPPLASPCLS